MADIEPGSGFPNPGDNNEKIAQQLIDQGNLTKTTKPEDLADTSSALDKLAQEKTSQTPEEKEAADKAAAEKAAADKAAADKAASDKTDIEKAAGEKTEAEKAAEKAAADKAAADKVVSDKADALFKDSPSLPPGASAKSTEAFASIKIRATQEISSRDQKIEDLQKQLQERDEKLKNPIPPELQNELKQLREWRAKLDVEVDPKFKEFDKSADSARDFIYAQLLKSPAIAKEDVEKIKKLGGPDMVNMSKVFEAIKDPTMQRLVETKLAEIETVKFNKEQAIKSAKDNIDKYLSERQSQFEKSAVEHNQATRQIVEDLTGRLSWFQLKKAEANADDATKKSVEEYNKFIEKTGKELQEALSDDSPQMRGVLLTGMAQLFFERREHAAEKATFDATKKENESLKAKVTELEEKISKFKQSSISRMREGGAPPSGQLPTTKKEVDFSTPAIVALDDIAKQVMEEKRAKGLA